jgi:SprT-like family protein
VLHHHPRTVLERLFDDLNTELFDGRIAPCAVRRTSYLTRLHGCDGLYEPSRHQILIQSGLSTRAERRVLIHEMCHARLPAHHGHGSAFRNQLRRLARRGEAWAIQEANRYANDPWFHVLDALDDLDHQWHTLPRTASSRARSMLVARAERLLARI